MFLNNELFICDLCITVIEIVKNQESCLNGPRSKYAHHLNNWAIVQKSNLHIYLCILLWIVLPFLILFWKTILPVCYFNSSNTHIWGLEAPSSWYPPARWGFQTDTASAKGIHFTQGTSYENSVKYEGVEAKELVKIERKQGSHRRLA